MCDGASACEFTCGRVVDERAEATESKVFANEVPPDHMLPHGRRGRSASSRVKVKRGSRAVQCKVEKFSKSSKKKQGQNAKNYGENTGFRFR